MTTSTARAAESKYGLERHGIQNVNTVYWNLCTPRSTRRRSGGTRGAWRISVLRRADGTVYRAISARQVYRSGTIQRGQSVVGRRESSHGTRSVRPSSSPVACLSAGRDVFVQDCFAGADPGYRLPIRVVTETAWHNLFARNMFIQAEPEELTGHVPQFTLIHAPNFHAIPEIDGTHSEVFIVVNFAEKVVLIGGTQYAGEIKKSIFSVMNYLLPQQNVLSMHSSANIGPDGAVAIFFGLSGTGKTTLSADPSRTLIGDDEHGWSDRGVFNLEGGCYAKVIHLSAKAEPEIYETTRKFGTILENVGMDSATGRLNLDDASLTENTRAAYPISHIPNATREGMGGHPKHIIMLTADAFGVLPPISRLTPAQAMYHFLSGYTAKVAGTEKGVTEPQATFSACFGAAFMSLSPGVYARLLGEKIAAQQVNVWLVNTGWSGGPYGVGHRMPINHTRAMVHAALAGALDRCRQDRIRPSVSLFHVLPGCSDGHPRPASHLV